MRYVCLLLWVVAGLSAQEVREQREERRGEEPAKAVPDSPEQQEKKASSRQKARELMDAAADTVGTAQPQVQVSALLHLGENYHALDSKKALECLTQAFATAATLPSSRGSDPRGSLQAEIVYVTADVKLDKAVEMLPQLSVPPTGRYDQRTRPTEKVVRLLVERREFDSAIELIASVGTSGEYPFRAARLIFQKLPEDDPRRIRVFAEATSAYIGRPNGPFADFVSRHWKEVPRPMAESAVKALVNAILDRKDDSFMSSNIATAKGTVALNSRQDIELFNVMHVLRAFDSKRADELLESRAELWAALERFPMGMESMRSGDQDNISQSTFSGSKDRRDPKAEAQQRLRSLAESRAAETMAVMKEDPQKAVSMVKMIPVPAIQARVLGAIANSVGDNDSSTAKSVIGQCIRILEDLKEPMERVGVWDGVAEAAHRVGDDQGAWEAIEKALEDAAALYKQDTNADDPNQALREYWPSTQSYRRIIYRATAMFGPEAEPLLAKITDPDLALLARIEMAQALLGRPRTQGNISVSKPGK
jgi:hypothetical protein